MDQTFLFPTFVFLAAACIAVPLASRLKLGAVFGYLAAGILVGPFGFSLIDNSEQVMHFAEFGVVMMLFMIGLELEPPTLWRMRYSILGLGGLQLTLTSAAFTAIGMAMGFSWQTSLTVGMALSLSSTALVLHILEERNLTHTPAGERVFAVLLFQDIAVIPMLVLIPLMAGDDHAAPHGGALWLKEMPGYLHAAVTAAVIAAVIFAVRHLSYYLFLMVARTQMREVFTATSLALIVGVTLLMQTLGISPALGAFVAGVALANSEYRHTLETDLTPFKGLFLGLFFISVGMGMDFDLFGERPLALIGAAMGVMAVKACILFILGKQFKLDLRQNSGFALILSQGGEFAFVLFQFAGGLRLLADDDAKFLTMTVALSIALTPLLVLAYRQYVIPRFMSELPAPKYDTITELNPVIIAGFGRFGQVIGRFLLGQGVRVTVLEKDPDQIGLLRNFGYKGYFGDATNIDLLRSAGASKARMLIVAVDDADACLDIVRQAKEQFPNLKIYARARNRQHAHDLHMAGVDYFKREMFDSSLAMAQEIMIALGYSKADMHEKAARFAAHDEESLWKSFEFFDSEPDMQNYVRLRRAELEQLLQQDVQAPPLERLEKVG